MKVFCLTSFLGGCYQCFKFPSKKFNNATMLEAHYYSEKKNKKIITEVKTLFIFGNALLCQQKLQ